MRCLLPVAPVRTMCGVLLTLALLAASPSYGRDCQDSGTPLTPPCTLQREAWNDHNHTCTTRVCHPGGTLQARCKIGYCEKQVRICENAQWKDYENHDEYTASIPPPSVDLPQGCYDVTLSRAHKVSGGHNPAEYCGGQLGVASAYQEIPDQGPGGVVVEAC